jgi:hypothetical protein
VLIEYVPAYACTLAVNESPTCKSCSGNVIKAPVVVGAGVVGFAYTLIEPRLFKLLPLCSLYPTDAVSLAPWVNHVDGILTDATQWPVVLDGVHDADTVEPLNDVGVTCTTTVVLDVSTLKDASRTCTATNTFGLSDRTPFTEIRVPITLLAAFCCVWLLVVACTVPMLAVNVGDDPMAPSMKYPNDCCVDDAELELADPTRNPGPLFNVNCDNASGIFDNKPHWRSVVAVGATVWYWVAGLHTVNDAQTAFDETLQLDCWNCVALQAVHDAHTVSDCDPQTVWRYVTPLTHWLQFWQTVSTVDVHMSKTNWSSSHW